MCRLITFDSPFLDSRKKIAVHLLNKQYRILRVTYSRNSPTAWLNGKKSSKIYEEQVSYKRKTSKRSVIASKARFIAIWRRFACLWSTLERFLAPVSPWKFCGGNRARTLDTWDTSLERVDSTLGIFTRRCSAFPGRCGGRCSGAGFQRSWAVAPIPSRAIEYAGTVETFPIERKLCSRN